MNLFGLCYDTDMNIIAIDPGYDRVGVAILQKPDSGKEVIQYSTCITTDRKADFYDRLKDIQSQLSIIIQEHKPEIMVMEELYFANNSTTALKVSEARGIISGAALQQNIQIREIHPNHVKIAITGNGAAKKADILWMIPKLVDITTEGKLDDELDAIAIGIAFFAHFKYEALLGK